MLTYKVRDPIKEWTNEDRHFFVESGLVDLPEDEEWVKALVQSKQVSLHVPEFVVQFAGGDPLPAGDDAPVTTAGVLAPSLEDEAGAVDAAFEQVAPADKWKARRGKR